MQRAGVLSELPRLLRDIGVDDAAVFAGSGIDVATLTPDTRVPFDRLLPLLDTAVGESNCPHLGILLGLRFDLKIHGPLGQVMRHASTLREALTDFVTWQSGYSTGAIVYLNRYGAEFVFGYGCYASSMPGSRVLYDAGVAVGVEMIRQLTGGSAQPVEIDLSYREPENAKEYASLLKARVRFNQDRTCLVLDEATMQTAIVHADRTTRQHHLSEIRQAAFPVSPDLSSRTRRALRKVMTTASPTLSAVAAEVGMHPRTFSRKLAIEGKNFETLRNEVRSAVARELLELTDIPVGEIGEILFYASAGVFSESFRRTNGVPPSTWRRLSKRKWSYPLKSGPP